jgi:hypothetical protein
MHQSSITVEMLSYPAWSGNSATSLKDIWVDPMTNIGRVESSCRAAPVYDYTVCVKTLYCCSFSLLFLFAEDTPTFCGSAFSKEVLHGH